MDILVVDDDEMICKLLDFLLTDAGHRVRVATSLRGARHAVESQKLDLAILDVQLPDGDGFAFCSELLEHGLEAPVIFLTARRELDDRLTGLHLGADDYVLKPFEPAELLARVSAVLRRSRAARSTTQGNYRVGDVELRVGDLRVIVGRKRIAQLTPTEMRVLQHLMANAGEVVTRESLANNVWGYAYSGESNHIDVYIRRLRQKVEGASVRPHYIQTVRGLGYRFVAA